MRESTPLPVGDGGLPFQMGVPAALLPPPPPPAETAGALRPASLVATILDRDRHTCRFCGFRARRHQEILALGAPTETLDPDHLVTVCIFCHDCFRLTAAEEMNSARVVWLPELDQPTMSHIARESLLSLMEPEPQREKAERFSDQMKERAEVVEARIGTSSPGELDRLLARSGNDPELRQALQGIRLCPAAHRVLRHLDLKFNPLPQMGRFWRSRSGPYRSGGPYIWLDRALEVC